MATGSDAYELNYECAHPNEYLDFITAIKHRVQMFYFDSNTTDVVWWTVPWNPNNISFQTLIKLIASGSMNVSDISSDARFNVYKDDFAVIKFY